MNRTATALAAFFALSAYPAFAASPAVDSAVKALSQLESDAAKLQGYCKIIKEMDAAGEDEAKAEALGQQLEDLLISFGPQYQQVLELSESTDSETADGQALEAAFDKLDEKCGG